MPVPLTAGATSNRPAFELPVTSNVTDCDDSLDAPSLIAVAHPATVFSPLSSATVSFGPLLKLGGSFTGVMWTVTVATSVPPFSSCAVYEKLSVPFASSSGT